MLLCIPHHIPFLGKKLWFNALHLERLTETEKYSEEGRLSRGKGREQMNFVLWSITMVSFPLW